MKRYMVVSTDNQQKPIFKVEVLDEPEMVQPGWIKFRLEASAPEWEEPTVCWYRIPSHATSIEMQCEVEDADVLSRARDGS